MDGSVTKVGGCSMKSALVLGAGGFIGSHMARKLRNDGYYVRGADLKLPEFSESACNEFFKVDLRDLHNVKKVFDLSGLNFESFDLVFQFAADMGGAGFVFTGENDAEIMHNSAMVNLNVLEVMRIRKAEILNFQTKVFYSSSACMYPEEKQLSTANPKLSEDLAYPANPDSEYGWEKLFSERLYLAYNRNFGIKIAIARYHNIFGPEGTWRGGREKAPAAICRKIAEAAQQDSIEIWGDGEQTRSFLFIDECLEATLALVRHPEFYGPVNIGSEEMVTINELARLVTEISGKNISLEHISGPLGVRGRNSDNQLIREKLGTNYSMSLEEGLRITYEWILEQVQKQ